MWYVQPVFTLPQSHHIFAWVIFIYWCCFSRHYKNDSFDDCAIHSTMLSIECSLRLISEECNNNNNKPATFSKWIMNWKNSKTWWYWLAITGEDIFDKWFSFLFLFHLNSLLVELPILRTSYFLLRIRTLLAVDPP